MAIDVTSLRTKPRESGPTVVHVPAEALHCDGNGRGPAAQELLAFVKALARDLARADADRLRHGRLADQPLEDACGEATSHDRRTSM